jgi:hypothetical protein
MIIKQETDVFYENLFSSPRILTSVHDDKTVSIDALQKFGRP